jgi:hypothetical protein
MGLFDFIEGMSICHYVVLREESEQDGPIFIGGSFTFFVRSHPGIPINLFK